MITSRRLTLSVLWTIICCPLSICCTDGATETFPAQTVTIRVLTANIGSHTTGFPGENLTDAVKAAMPDIIAIQEPLTNGIALAESLEYTRTELHFPTRSTEVLSPYPVVNAHDTAVDLEYCPGQMIRFSSIHASYNVFDTDSYGPYALRDNPDFTEQEIIDAQVKEHEADIAVILSTMDSSQSTKPVASFVAGDFNEPSHLDWTVEASALHLNRAISWPSSTQLHEAGFVDAWRTMYPNPLTDPGNTWTPYGADDEVHDRIDMIYHRGNNVQVVSAEIVGEDEDHADIVITPFPSDHRFVVIEYQISGIRCR